MDIQFIYDIEMSKYLECECYLVYDVKYQNMVCDLLSNKTIIIVDRKNKCIKFTGMKTQGHYVIAKLKFYKIIETFLNQRDKFSCIDFSIDLNCSGGRIYQTYKK